MKVKSVGLSQAKYMALLKAKAMLEAERGKIVSLSATIAYLAEKYTNHNAMPLTQKTSSLTTVAQPEELSFIDTVNKDTIYEEGKHGDTDKKSGWDGDWDVLRFLRRQPVC